MKNEAMKEILNELFSHLERLETQSEAILQFLKEKKRVTDKQLAPYLEQAGNASNVRWRAARVRIEHFFEPERAEKEVKLGKHPELHDDSASAVGSENKRPESVDKEGKRTEAVDKENKRGEPSDKDGKHTESRNAEASGTDLNKKEKPAPADGNADKLEEKSESNQQTKEQAGQDQRKEKSDSGDFQHPTEVTEPLARQQGAEPAAQLSSKNKDDDQEAA